MTDDVTNDAPATGDESATGPGATTLVCSGCEETIGPKDELVRAFSDNELVPVCVDCAPDELEYTIAQPCVGCGRPVRYERSQHRREFSSCDESCRLAGLARRRRSTAALARRKRCLYCDTAFVPQRRDGLYCAPPCRKRAHAASRRAAG